MVDTDAVWRRIERYAGEEFQTIRGLPFSYVVPGNYLRVSREGREVNRSLSRTNFVKAMEKMPAQNPSDLMGRQGQSYTWAILMDHRIREDDW